VQTSISMVLSRVCISEGVAARVHCVKLVASEMNGEEVASLALNVRVFGNSRYSLDRGNEGHTSALADDIAPMFLGRNSLATRCFINTTEQASPRLLTNNRTL
jgi:hypothetical protein